MTETYSRLISRIKELQGRADRLHKVRAKAIARVNGLIEEYGISADELALGGRRRGRPKTGTKPANGRGRKRAKLAPKYRGPGGQTWAGRGLMPVWMRQALAKGKKKEEFLIRQK